MDYRTWWFEDWMESNNFRADGRLDKRLFIQL